MLMVCVVTDASIKDLETKLNALRQKKTAQFESLKAMKSERDRNAAEHTKYSSALTQLSGKCTNTEFTFEMLCSGPILFSCLTADTSLSEIAASKAATQLKLQEYTDRLSELRMAREAASQRASQISEELHTFEQGTCLSWQLQQYECVTVFYMQLITVSHLCLLIEIINST